MSRRSRFPLVVAVVAVTLLASAFLAARILLSESLVVKEGTLSYYLVVSPLIRSVPRLEPVGAPELFYSASDGPKPSLSQIHYTSLADAAELRQTIGEYLAAAGFHATSSSTGVPAREYTRADSTVEIELSGEGDLRRVEVNHYQH